MCVPQLKLDKSQAKAEMPYKMSVPMALLAQHSFYAMVLIQREVGRRKVNTIRTTVNSMFGAVEGQLVQKAWDTLVKSFSTGPLRVAIERYMWLGPTVIHIQVV